MAEFAKNPESLVEDLRQELGQLRAAADLDPFGNPLLLASLHLSRRLDRQDISLAELDAIVGVLNRQAFADRVAHQAAYLGETDPALNEARIRGVIRDLAGTPLLPFAEFRALVERPRFGIVLTAHPTFGMSVDLARNLASLATGRDKAGKILSVEELDQLRRTAGAANPLPHDKLTLALEHSWSLEVLDHIQDAIDRLNRIILDVAAELYPTEWGQLRPALITAASWVGYDLDGRSDIAWTDTLEKRLLVKAAQLARFQRQCAALLPVQAGLAPVTAALDLAAETVRLQLQAIAAIAVNDQDFNGLMAAFPGGRAAALTDAASLIPAVDHALAGVADPSLRRDLLVLRASFASHGQGLAHTHVRLNATQLHNAIRREVGMETAPNDPGHRRSYMHAINDLLGRVQKQTINFVGLMAEPASAKRLFMIVQQIVKYIDGRTPVRFLIAETEAGFTLLTALYFARLFGVEDQVEISPLYETAEALERGDAILEEALRSPHYRAYVERLGRVAVQFGFSDSGRYLGQMAATFQIERLRLRLAALLERLGLAHIQLILFNTHGESIGRGGHPVTLGDRLLYASPPYTRAEFARRGIGFKEEVSFQGGDGFAWFMGRASALAVMRGVVETMLQPDPEAQGDPIYTEGDYAVEFFATIKQEFSDLVEDPNYAGLLGAFGGNLMAVTGSRPVKRQHEGAARAMDLAHVSQLRAIPNNGILQQLGLFANTLFGVGQARVKDPELFDLLRRGSPRFRRALAMVGAALAYSSLDVLRGYIDSLDPGMWLTRAGRTRSPLRAKELREVSASLEALDLHPALIKLYRRLQADFLLLTDRPGTYGGGVKPEITAERRDTVLLLHVVRFVVIHRIYLLAVHIPDFTPHRGLTRDDLIARLLRLDVPAALVSLKEIFPKAPPLPVPKAALAEPATYRVEASQGYAAEHSQIFEPLAALYQLVLRLGAALSHEIGAVG